MMWGIGQEETARSNFQFALLQIVILTRMFENELFFSIGHMIMG